MDESASFLMEKLRAKGGTYKSFKDYSKSLRMTLQEKRYALEVTEKIYLQECLDLLQQNIIVSSLPAIMERLEVISRHLGLKFTSSGLDWFISSDMFYIEVVVESNGHIKDVKIHHDGIKDRQSCEELKMTLVNRDFKDFTLQLEGLISIYNLNADQKVKSKAFTSLQNLEADIVQLAELQCMYMNDPFDIIHKSDVGFVQKRRGGHPMKIIYFISPYDLLDITKNTFKPLTLDVPEVDYCVSLCLESSSTNKLQTQPLVKLIKSERMDENSDLHQPTALFEELTPTNTNLLPACFIMKLKERMPICETLINQMKEITDIEVKKIEGPFPILSLIRREIHEKHSECEEDSSIVTLPDQRHCYIMTNNSDLRAYIVHTIPFSHPSHVSKILPLLRQQALFNSFIASCIRPKATKDTCDKPRQNSSVTSNRDSEYINGFGLKLFGSEDFKNLSNFSESPEKTTPSDITMFEVMPLSLQQITVSFEHPIDETLVTAELDLSDVSDLRCNISMASEDSNMSVTNAQECAGRALQRSFSIPATMRILIRLWESQSDTSDEEDLNESSANNDVADLNETADSNLETEASKENGECASVDFNPDVTIKLETSDSCENSLDGFSSSLANRAADFNTGPIFDLPNPAHGFPTFDVDMAPAAPVHTFEAPLPFLDNASGPPMFEPKTEPAEFAENHPFFRNKPVVGGSGGDLFGSKACEIVIDSSSDSEPTDATKEALADAKPPSPSSAGSDFSALTELAADLPIEKPLSEFDMNHGMMEVNSLEDVQQFLKLTENNKISKNEDSNTLTPSLISDLVLPSVSITAVTLPAPTSASASQASATLQNVLSGVCVERRHGDGVSTPSLPASLTITALPMKEVDERAKERKKQKSVDDKAKLEKMKKKRKRDDSPMGPPEKKSLKTADPMTKPVSVSIKPTEVTSRSPSPGGTLRKFAMSPTQPLSLLGKVSPNSASNNNNNVKKQSVSSPGLTGSPKMGVSVSPKHNITSSPKNVSSGSSGKPSMSALKSAVTSPSSGSKVNNELKKSYKDPAASRENKEKKSSNGGSGSSGSGHPSPKPKSSNMKFKQADAVATVLLSPQYEGSPGGTDPKLMQPQLKNKKGLHLASVIDKLNKQQEDKCNNGDGKGCSPSMKNVKSSGGGGGGQVPDAKAIQAAKVSNEYMVKQHSSDGIKMTISNRSRKDQVSNKLASTKNSSATAPSGGGSPKQPGSKLSTGPGNAVVVCKKLSSTKPPLSSMSSNNAIASKHSSKTGGSSGGGSSGSSSKSKSNHSPKGGGVHPGADPNRKEKARPSKVHSDKSIFSAVPKRSSPSTQNDSGDGDKPYKMAPYQTPVVFTKHLDTNFQIPKISDRNKTSGDGEMKKSTDGLTGPPDADHKDGPAKGDSVSPVKVSYMTAEESKVLLEAVKSTSLYEAKKATAANNDSSIDVMANPTSQHQMTSNCSISASVQSNDSIKVNL